MAETFKILGSYAGTVTTGISVYKVPAATQTSISSITICNNSSSIASFKVWIQTGGAAAGTTGISVPSTSSGAFLFYNQPLEGNTTFIATVGLTLAATDTVIVSSSATTMSFNLFGVEIS